MNRIDPHGLLSVCLILVKCRRPDLSDAVKRMLFGEQPQSIRGVSPQFS
jgi:hypothetical protein